MCRRNRVKLADWVLSLVPQAVNLLFTTPPPCEHKGGPQGWPPHHSMPDSRLTAGTKAHSGLVCKSSTWEAEACSLPVCATNCLNRSDKTKYQKKCWGQNKNLSPKGESTVGQGQARLAARGVGNRGLSFQHFPKTTEEGAQERSKMIKTQVPAWCEREHRQVGRKINHKVVSKSNINPN